MTLLTALGAASLAFTAWFTWTAYRSGDNPRAAIVEAWINIVIGFSVNFLANFFILPLVDARLTASQNFWLGWIYTSISIIRQYAIRRWFQERLHKAALKLAGEST